eukprot:1186530-Prorocentrum_minimum.AAC.1
MAERAMEMTRARMAARKAFGKALAEHGALLQQLAEMRIQVEGARLAVLNAAHQFNCPPYASVPHDKSRVVNERMADWSNKVTRTSYSFAARKPLNKPTSTFCKGDLQSPS